MYAKMKRFVLFVVLLALVLATLVGCGGGASKNDLAVCDAYQQLVDSWPADSAQVHAAGSADEIFDAIADTGQALVAASQLADDPELADAAETVGENAVKFVEGNANLRERGFIPFFAEHLIGGSELSQICTEIGRPISLP